MKDVLESKLNSKTSEAKLNFISQCTSHLENMEKLSPVHGLRLYEIYTLNI